MKILIELVMLFQKNVNIYIYITIKQYLLHEINQIYKNTNFCLMLLNLFLNFILLVAKETFLFSLCWCTNITKTKTE